MRFEAAVAGQLTQTLSTSQENVGGVGLRHEEEHGEPNGTGEPENLPQAPSPVLGRHAEARDDGTHGWAHAGGEGPEREHVGEFDERVHIPEGSAARSQARRSEKALEEAKDEKAGKVVHKGGRHGQDHENGECDHVRWIPSDQRNLAQRTENKWSNTVGQDVQAQSQRRCCGTDVETLHDALSGGRYNC